MPHPNVLKLRLQERGLLPRSHHLADVVGPFIGCLDLHFGLRHSHIATRSHHLCQEGPLAFFEHIGGGIGIYVFFSDQPILLRDGRVVVHAASLRKNVFRAASFSSNSARNFFTSPSSSIANLES